MAIEIELKAWLDKHEPVKARLSSIGNYIRSFEKTDTYWLPIQEDAPSVSISQSGLRVRRESSVGADDRESSVVFVTVKKRKVIEGVEVNDEREFCVSDAGLFEELAADLGLFKAMYKKKRGWEWVVQPEGEGSLPICAEISMVKDLGWFLELEILARNDKESAVAECRKDLFSLLGSLGVPEEKIESKPYSTLLRERWLISNASPHSGN